MSAMTTDIKTLLRAADLLSADAESLRQCHNVDPQNPNWQDEPDARAEHDEAICVALRLRLLAKRLTSDKERADYAWRNTNTIEKARQEEMLKRDALEADVSKLRYHLTELAKFADRACMVLATIEAEDATEGEMLQEIIDGISRWGPSAILGQLAAMPPAASPAPAA